jgi:hypothetical protein
MATVVNDLLSELSPEELEPRLELQVLADPLGIALDLAGNNNCRDGGTCNVKQQ